MPDLRIVDKWPGVWFWQVWEGDRLDSQAARPSVTEAEAKAAWQAHIDAVLILHCERT